MTVPWSSVRAYSVCTAGSMFDSDCELKFNVMGKWCADPGKDVRENTDLEAFVQQDLKKNKV